MSDRRRDDVTEIVDNLLTRARVYRQARELRFARDRAIAGVDALLAGGRPALTSEQTKPPWPRWTPPGNTKGKSHV